MACLSPDAFCWLRPNTNQRGQGTWATLAIQVSLLKHRASWERLVGEDLEGHVEGVTGIPRPDHLELRCSEALTWARQSIGQGHLTSNRAGGARRKGGPEKSQKVLVFPSPQGALRFLGEQTQPPA